MEVSHLRRLPSSLLSMPLQFILSFKKLFSLRGKNLINEKYIIQDIKIFNFSNISIKWFPLKTCAVMCVNMLFYFSNC